MTQRKFIRTGLSTGAAWPYSEPPAPLTRSEVEQLIIDMKDCTSWERLPNLLPEDHPRYDIETRILDSLTKNKTYRSCATFDDVQHNYDQLPDGTIRRTLVELHPKPEFGL